MREEAFSIGSMGIRSESTFNGCLSALTARLSHHANPSTCPPENENGARHSPMIRKLAVSFFSFFALFYLVNCIRQ